MGGFHNQIDVSWGACKKPIDKVRRTGSVLKSFLTSQPRKKKHALSTEISRREHHPLVFLENTEQMDDIVMNQKPETETASLKSSFFIAKKTQEEKLV